MGWSLSDLEPSNWGNDINKIPVVGNLVGSALGTKPAAQADTSGIKQAQANAFGVEDALAKERAAYRGQYNTRTNATLGGAGMDAITQLQQAATGAVPSAAEIQLRNQAARNAANSFGVASALQGRSPGGALHQALVNNAGAQAQTNSDAAALHANEMANARGQLVGAIQGQQQNQLGLRQGDITQQGNLLSGQTSALNAGTSAATGLANANATNAAAQNQATAGALGILGGVTNKLISDEREKTNVHRVDLDGLAKALEGFRFRYKDPANGTGERVGVMAQDAEKGGPIGRAMVRNVGGTKALDTGNAVGAALAMAAEALKRTRKAA